MFTCVPQQTIISSLSCLLKTNLDAKVVHIISIRQEKYLKISFCGVSTFNSILYPSSQASADPTSHIYIVAFSFSIHLKSTYISKISQQSSKSTHHISFYHRGNFSTYSFKQPVDSLFSFIIYQARVRNSCVCSQVGPYVYV